MQNSLFSYFTTASNITIFLLFLLVSSCSEEIAISLNDSAAYIEIEPAYVLSTSNNVNLSRDLYKITSGTQAEAFITDSIKNRITSYKWTEGESMLVAASIMTDFSGAYEYNINLPNGVKIKEFDNRVEITLTASQILDFDRQHVNNRRLWFVCILPKIDKPIFTINKYKMIKN
jgi:hypothetical protein